MTNIDDKIRAALEEEDAELLADYQGDAPLHEQLIDLYRGRLRWINVMATLGSFLLVILLLVCAYQFFHTQETRSMLAWATAFLTTFVWLALMKLWFWLEMNKNSVTREVKRVELQLASLSHKLGPDKT